MNEVINEGESREENDAQRGRYRFGRGRIPTLAWVSTPECMFNELISAIHSMMGEITTM